MMMIVKTIIEPKKAAIGHQAESTDFPVVKNEYRVITTHPTIPSASISKLKFVLSFFFTSLGDVAKNTKTIINMMGIRTDASNIIFSLA